MSAELAVRAATLPEKMKYAEALAFSFMLPEQYRKQPANVLWAIEYGETIGITAMAAITGVHMIEGKPTASAALISGLVRRAGHRLRSGYDAATRTGWAEIVRSDDPDYTFRSEWNLDRAIEAELVQVGENGELIAKDSKGRSKPWKKFYPSMTKARAITEVARDACEEVLFGLHYTPEELGADTDDEGNLVVRAARAAMATAADPWLADAQAPAAPQAGAGAEAEYAEVVEDRPAEHHHGPVETEWDTATRQPLPPPAPGMPTVTGEQLGEIARLLKLKRGATNGNRNFIIGQMVRRPVENVQTLSASEAAGIVETLTAEPDLIPLPAAEAAEAAQAGPTATGITDPQQRMMHALLNKQGHTRDGGHALMTRVTGREITSAKQLTKDEANAVITALTTGEIPAPTPAAKSGPDEMGEGISEFDALDQMILDVASDEAAAEVEKAIADELVRGGITRSDAELLLERHGEHVRTAKAGAA